MCFQFCHVAGVGTETSLFVLLNDNGPLRVGQAGRQLFNNLGSKAFVHVCHIFPEDVVYTELMCQIIQMVKQTPINITRSWPCRALINSNDCTCRVGHYSPAVVRNRENGVSVKVQLEQVSRPSTSVLTSRCDIKAPLIINSSHPAGRHDQHPAIPPSQR